MPSDAQLISIILPVFDRPNYLRMALESLARQPFKNYELVIVDDGSAEDISFARQHCDVFIRQPANLGCALARNVAVARCTGGILLFIDSDVEVLHNSLQLLPSVFAGDHRIGAAGGSGPPTAVGDDARCVVGKLYGRRGQTRRIRLEPGDAPAECDHIASAFLAVRRSVFEEVGGFDPYLPYVGEDRDLCLRIRDRGYRILAVPATRVIHHGLVTTKNIPDNKNLTSRQIAALRYCEVATKREGMRGGAAWLAFNSQTWIREPSLYRPLAATLARSRSLRSRMSANHLRDVHTDFMTLSTDHLHEAQPFDVKYPLATPNHLYIFVNQICNAFCDHCFIIHNKPGKQQRLEIPRAQLQQLVSSCNRQVAIHLTGGEPLLRRDLPDILLGWLEMDHVKRTSIVSNGSLPSRLQDLCTKALDAFPNKRLHVQLSLDGPPDVHDRIRHLEGGFDRVMDSCARLSRLAKLYSNCTFVVSLTAMAGNLHEVRETVSLLEARHIPSKVTLVRGNSFSTFGVPSDLIDVEYEPNQPAAIEPSAVEELIHDIATAHPGYFTEMQERKLRVMIATMRAKTRQLPCYAGYDEAVIHSDGSIGLCEQVRSFGNLADYGWDLAKAWNSRNAQDHRLKLTSCACIHGCNISTALDIRASRGKRTA